MEKNWAVVVLVIITIILVFHFGDFGEQQSILGPHNTLNNCESARNDYISQDKASCITECIYCDLPLVNCLNQCTSGIGDKYLGKYAFYANYGYGDYECSELTTSNTPDYCWFNCININLKTCNTPADIDCNGQVSRTEMGDYISKYILGSISRSALGEAITAYVGG